MRFTARTKMAARLRQYGRCAGCGERLDDIEEHAHHVHPHALGGADAVDNCVILCVNCHEHVHAGGGFRSGVVAPRSYYRYWNG
ncbi:MAG: HNH endonuclease signature motif containing protein [Candidatus Eisenbacteria bacterium]